MASLELRWCEVGGRGRQHKWRRAMFDSRLLRQHRARSVGLRETLISLKDIYVKLLTQVAQRTHCNVKAHLLQLRHLLAAVCQFVVILFLDAAAPVAVVRRVQVILVAAATDGEPTREPRQRFIGRILIA